MVPRAARSNRENPIDTKHVKHIKIKSALLSKFWGQPMYIAADVLLPEGYDDPANRRVRYPVVWEQGHFEGEASTRVVGRRDGFSSGGCPKLRPASSM